MKQLCGCLTIKLPPTAASCDLVAVELTFEEAIRLTSEPIAVFDHNAVLSLANVAFRDAARPVVSFLAPGTPWPVLLAEAARKDLLTEVGAACLRMIEERYIDRPEAQPEVIFTRPDGTPALAQIRRTSDGGFILSLQPAPSHGAPSDSELEELMSKVLQACPTCLIMSRIGDGRILYRSPAAVELLGKGFNSLEHFAKRAERADFLAGLLPNARIDDMRITASGTDGRRFPASISARLIDYRGEDVIVASIDDLTEQLKATAEIERQEKQLFQLEKMSALGEVLSGIAHELNNPLSVVVGNAHLLLEEDISDDLRPRIERMTSAAERCVRIVRTFLSMARDRPLDLQLRKTSDVIAAAVEAFRGSEMSGDLTLSVDVADDLPELRVDEVQMVQVFVNILTNASQAMIASGTGSEIMIDAERRKSGVYIRLSDDGPGVPPEVRDRIFDPLFTTKEAGEGTGLGLALCHRIVVAHGGSIELAPGTGPGATFIINLPALS